MSKSERAKTGLGTDIAPPERPTAAWDADAAKSVYIDSVAAIYIGSTYSYVITGDEEHRSTELFLQGLSGGRRRALPVTAAR